MNVVIFGKGFGTARQVNLSGKAVAAIGVVFAACLSAAAFGFGSWYSAQNGSGVPYSELTSLAEELAAQQAAIATTRQQTEDTLDALAIRIGQMNARIIRLDALGRRMTEMANLEDGEFNFDSDPALGGRRVTPSLTHQQVADMIGTSRETVTRAVKDLKASGWLEQRGKRYLVP